MLIKTTCSRVSHSLWGQKSLFWYFITCKGFLDVRVSGVYLLENWHTHSTVSPFSDI